MRGLMGFGIGVIALGVQSVGWDGFSRAAAGKGAVDGESGKNGKEGAI